MHHRLLVPLVLLLLIIPASASAGTTGHTQDAYRCDASFDNYTGCAVIKNEIQTWTAPGRLETRFPLVFAAFQNVQSYWRAQRSIPAGGTGDAAQSGRNPELEWFIPFRGRRQAQWWFSRFGSHNFISTARAICIYTPCCKS